MNALDSALRSVMTGDTGAGGLDTLSADGIYQLSAPARIGTPPNDYAPRTYTIFQELLDNPNYNFGNALSNDFVFIQIKHFAVDDPNNSGQSTSGQMVDRCRTLLTNPSLSVSGKTVLCCRFNRSLPAMKEWDEANNRFIYSKGGIYEVWLA